MKFSLKNIKKFTPKYIYVLLTYDSGLVMLYNRYLIKEIKKDSIICWTGFEFSEFEITNFNNKNIFIKERDVLKVIQNNYQEIINSISNKLNTINVTLKKLDNQEI